jgi:hypothetical protein
MLQNTAGPRSQTIQSALFIKEACTDINTIFT